MSPCCLPFLLISVLTIAMGAFLALNPSLAIKIQIKFYEKINWRVEPISMQKEIRNTRAMGIFIIIFVLFAAIFKLSMR